MSGRNAPHGRAALLVVFALSIGTLAVFGRLAQAPFVALDDPAYVSENPQVRAGLTSAGFRWAWSTFHEANWHPLTWLSHQLDVSLFGVKPGPHHLVNVLLHLANSLLLLHFLRTMTGRLWVAAAVAALFALHPLHIESVAWVAERKDVLSTLLLLLTLLAYQRAVRRPSAARAAAVPAIFALALLAKPMVVTLPALLLLLDWWPLGRFGAGAGGLRRFFGRAPLLEKVPIVLLALAVAAVTYIAQARGGAVRSLDVFPLGWRLENAVVSTLQYLGATLWPAHLAIYYPHPRGSIPAWLVGGSTLALGAACVAALVWARRFPYLAVGWYWYLVTLLPVVGLIQVGVQARADRYTYVPLIGIFLAVCWGVATLARKTRGIAFAAPLLAAGVLLALAGRSWVQVGHYRSNEELFLQTLAVTQGNNIIHVNLGALYMGAGNLDAAERQYRLALEIRPDGAEENFNFGDLLVKRKKHAEAVPFLRRALAADPDYPKAHYYLGMYLAQQGAVAEARFHLGQALRFFPDNPVIRSTYERLAAQALP